MSLINDALKRASQKDQSRPRQPETMATMKPVDDGGLSTFALVLAAGIFLALVLAGWFFWQSFHANRTAAAAKVAPPSAIIPPQPVPAPIVHEVVAPPAAPAPSFDSPPKPAPEAWPVELKLKAIFFSATKPMALINSETLGVGDLINGVRVTKIERDRVTVQWNGQAKELIAK